MIRFVAAFAALLSSLRFRCSVAVAGGAAAPPRRKFLSVLRAPEVQQPDPILPPPTGQEVAMGSVVGGLQGLLAAEAIAVTATKLDLNPNAAIAAANVAVYATWQVAKAQGEQSKIFKRMLKNFVFSSDDFKQQKFHTLLLSSFSHMDFDHLASNMICLGLFGPKQSRDMGPRSYSYFFIASLYASQLYSHFIYKHKYFPKELKFWRWTIRITRHCLGASGGISALQTFSCLKNPRDRMLAISVWGQEEIKIHAWMIWVESVWSDLFPTKGTNVLHGAHLGGHLFGGLALMAVRFREQVQARSVQLQESRVPKEETRPRGLRGRICSAVQMAMDDLVSVAKEFWKLNRLPVKDSRSKEKETSGKRPKQSCSVWFESLLEEEKLRKDATA